MYESLDSDDRGITERKRCQESFSSIFSVLGPEGLEDL